MSHSFRHPACWVYVPNDGSPTSISITVPATTHKAAKHVYPHVSSFVPLVLPHYSVHVPLLHRSSVAPHLNCLYVVYPVRDRLLSHVRFSAELQNGNSSRPCGGVYFLRVRPFIRPPVLDQVSIMDTIRDVRFAVGEDVPPSPLIY